MNIERVTLSEVKAACKAHIYDNCEGCPFQRGRLSCVVADRAAPLGWELGEDDGEGRREGGGEPMSQSGWNPCPVAHGYILNHKKLWDKNRRILVTYITPSGQRHVAQVWSTKGKIMSTKINGRIIAWMEMPEPYGGEICE